MIVVADTSPLIALSAIGQLELLRGVAEIVLVPPAVHREIVTNGRGWLAAKGIQDALTSGTWVEVRSPTAGAFLDRLRNQLDPGEAEALALARELGLAVFLDEAKARRAAAREKIEFFGTLGVLARGKSSGRIAAAEPLVRRMREAGIRFSDALIESFLRQLGEV